jgi:tRNA-intron endonuclease
MPSKKTKPAGSKMKKEKPIPATLLENKVIMKKGFSELEEKGFGKKIDKRLELAFVEALYLAEKKKIKVKKNNKAFTFEKLMEYGLRNDRRLQEKYVVYKDLRDRGLLVKSGLKFGCDFRCYERGVSKIKRGPKSPKEHTKWIVFAVPEGHTCSFQELSRAVRLAHNIRAKMLWAVVDDEADVTFYEIIRKKI